MDDTVEQQERRAQEVAERLVQNVARAFYDGRSWFYHPPPTLKCGYSA